MNLLYEIWDVFTDQPLQGNPLAVIPDATGLTNEQMLAIAKEFNLSETSFVLPSAKADVRAKYFTTTKELPVAGHPTIGTVFALHRRGKIKGEKLKLELKAGVFEIGLEQEATKLQRAWMDQGTPTNLGRELNRDRAAKAIGLHLEDLGDLPIILVSAGNPFVIIPVKSLRSLAQASLIPYSLSQVEGTHPLGIFVFTPHAKNANVQCRMFAEAEGSITEDPATGSAHGPLGWYMATYGLLEFERDTAQFVSHQGIEMGRPSELHVRVIKTGGDFSVSVGGHAVLVGEGSLYL
jgi:trans-2,3-dihydro-3-hydroxyanthranilate isomerase